MRGRDSGDEERAPSRKMHGRNSGDGEKDTGVGSRTHKALDCPGADRVLAYQQPPPPE